MTPSGIEPATFRFVVIDVKCFDYIFHILIIIYILLLLLCIIYFFLKVAPFIKEDAMGCAGSMDRVNKRFVHSCD
jgi:hypothetical protein